MIFFSTFSHLFILKTFDKRYCSKYILKAVVMGENGFYRLLKSCNFAVLGAGGAVLAGGGRVLNNDTIDLYWDIRQTVFLMLHVKTYQTALAISAVIELPRFNAFHNLTWFMLTIELLFQIWYLHVYKINLW